MLCDVGCQICTRPNEPDMLVGHVVVFSRYSCTRTHVHRRVTTTATTTATAATVTVTGGITLVPAAAPLFRTAQCAVWPIESETLLIKIEYHAHGKAAAAVAASASE